MRERIREREPSAAADVVARMLDRPGLRRLEEVARRANGDRRRRRVSGEGVLPKAEPGTG
ncbi:hypothetical protein GCM10023321_52860 [Pseudonocardia eucalypti]|uniref:Uncharacterized protein n=1 Tax=Pseudonocardia eucalypti TaxID=648755 RepID=A0ABP9QMC9_9PSEU|nr:hypothetical protein [Pseudonocardia eucalypti]